MADRKNVKDNGGRLLGNTESGRGGIEVGKSRQGNILGTYDSTSNTTRTSSGSVVGKGNLLGTLILGRNPPKK